MKSKDESRIMRINTERGISVVGASQVGQQKLVRCLSEPFYPLPTDVLQYDESDGPNQYIRNALNCIKDAAAQFTEVYNKIIQEWEESVPGIVLAISDACTLQPTLAHLATNSEREKLPVVKEMIVELGKQRTDMDKEHLSRAIDETKNAIILLHLGGVNLDNTVHVDIHSILGTPRQCLAAVMIIEKFFNDLILQWTD